MKPKPKSESFLSGSITLLGIFLSAHFITRAFMNIQEAHIIAGIVFTALGVYLIGYTLTSISYRPKDKRSLLKTTWVMVTTILVISFSTLVGIFTPELLPSLNRVYSSCIDLIVVICLLSALWVINDLKQSK